MTSVFDNFFKLQNGKSDRGKEVVGTYAKAMHEIDIHGRDGARPSLHGQGLDETNWGRKLLAPDAAALFGTVRGCSDGVICGKIEDKNRREK